VPDDASAGGTPLEEPAAQQPAVPAPGGGSGVTAGGYDYTVVGAETSTGDEPPREARRIVLSPLVLAAVIVVPAVLAAAGAWLALGMFDDGGDDGGRVNADVSNLINAFSQNPPGAEVQRFQGEAPPGFPDDVPSYPEAKIVASVVQVNEGDALYLVVYDTPDAREDVASHLADALDSDPWQVDAGRDGRTETFRQFSKIDDPDITGVALVTGSRDDELTTIVYSVEVVAGGRAAGRPEFTPPVSRTMPEDFPDVPQYPESIVIDAAFSRQPRETAYAVSLIVQDDAGSVLDYYRRELEGRTWQVEESDTANTSLENAEAIAFSAQEDGLEGSVTAGDFSEDRNYVQIDIQVTTTE
jgi:hypothetical protein